MNKLLFKAVSLGVSMVGGVVGGVLAGAIFKRGWKLAAGEDEAPKATDADHGWREILLAAAFKGAVFAVVKAALDRGAAVSARKLTGTRPDD
jgi:MFS family permease